MRRSRRLALNSFSSLLYQITSVICGFILPRMILSHYGSEVNGLVNSITQFLSIIAFLELGVGAVVQSSLYKPLAHKNESQISAILSSANKFFRKIAIILIIYIVILILFYPLIIHSAFDYYYVGALILSIGLSSFAQYYFGIVDRLLLSADQRGYIQFNAQTITTIATTAVCAILIECNCTIQMIKFISSVIFLFRPIGIRIYINKHYRINRKAKYTEEPIRQKWNGAAQHFAAIVLEHTDTIVLTSMSTLTNVSIYGVYHLVVSGIKTLITSLTNGVQPLLGELLAKDEIESLNKYFLWAEWAIHTCVSLAFSCVISLIIPFISIYTLEINDTNYIVPAFAYAISLANAMHCYRIPYNMMILAAGHYKQTQSNYVISAIINILVSVIFVKAHGLIGVALGTFIAMTYQTLWMAWYVNKQLLFSSMSGFVRHMMVNLLHFIISIFLSNLFVLKHYNNYFQWIVTAFEVGIINVIVGLIINCIFYSNYINQILRDVRIKRNGH